MRAQEIVERALGLSRSDGAIVVVTEESEANVRWANNTLTTNGVMATRRVTVIALVGAHGGQAVGVIGRSDCSESTLESLVRQAEAEATSSAAAEDALPLVLPERTPRADGWESDPELTGITTLGDLIVGLGECFDRARAERRLLYGFAHHVISTTYLGTSTGIRRRHVQPTGTFELTGKNTELTSSTWVGQTTRDFTDVDAAALDAEVVRRLGWAAQKVALAPGRYETLLPPGAVVDLLAPLYGSMGARDAFEGRTVFSRPHGETAIGDRLAALPLSMFSDPESPGLACQPFVTAVASTGMSSVFDNGLPLARTHWITDGVLSNLVTPRYAAELTGLAVAPYIDNLTLVSPDGAGTLDDLIASTQHGLLLTCLWYIREVDPQTMLLTGLTRDGVYLVEGGEVVGAVTNFRFNESPVDLLSRISEAGETVPTLAREHADYFPRAAVPALRVVDFNMSTVSPGV